MIEIANIYNNYVDDLFTYSIYLGFDKETAMDAIHDVFYKLASDKKRLNDISNIKSYLFKSLKNRLLDIYKAKKRNLELSDIPDSDELPFNFSINIEDELIDVEEKLSIREQIQNMLESLTARQREIVYLRYIQEYDYEQISNIMNISIHGCRKLLSKAMETLREKYGSLVLLLMFP